MPFTYTCKICDKEFTRRQKLPTANYCSRACNGQSKRLQLDPVLVGRLYSEHQSVEKIEKILGVSGSPVRKALAEAGYGKRKGGHRNQFGAGNHKWKGGVRLCANGYIKVKCYGHPRADKGGYVFEHILVMEKAIGRFTTWYSKGNPNNEAVHHINHNRQDNRLENLQLMTVSEHSAMHRTHRMSEQIQKIRVEMPLETYQELQSVVAAKDVSITSFILEWVRYGIAHTPHQQSGFVRV